MCECDLCKYYMNETDTCLFSYMGNGDVRYAPCYKEERKAKVAKVDMPSEHNKVYKCLNCGQYFHQTSWGSPVEYCSRCGARLEWK